MTLPVLPTYYYLDHFTEMLGFVETTYAGVLDSIHHDFINQFRALSADEQCLFVRMTNRRGNVFAISQLKYEEIGDAAAALAGLTRQRFLRALCEDDYIAWLATLKKDVLIEIARGAGCDDVRASWKKPRLIDHMVGRVPFHAAAEHGRVHEFVVRSNTVALDFLLYLYFGKTSDDLKSFALRDLGVLRVNDATQFKARFEGPSEAKACFYYAQIIDRIALPAGSVIEAAALALASGPVDGGDYARRLRERVALNVGKFFEKENPQRAIDCYRLVNAPDCNERIVRLLYASGRKDEAKALLEQLIDDPGSDDEYTFAADYYARKFNGRRTASCTQLLRESREVFIDETHRGHPEAGVAALLRRERFEVYFAENLLWHGLFGLLLWDELFESGQLHSGFDWVPHCLKDNSFARTFEPEVSSKLAAIRDGNALPLILKTVASRWEKPNGIFSWQAVDIDALRALLTFGDRNAVASVVDQMTRDFRSMRDGFPDLMLVREGRVSFVEIKAQGDAIRRNQLTRLRQMQAAGFDAGIVRADYRFDPEQVYVVVDIETTGGGWGGTDRITEIGAVKIQNHRIVDRWHSLINPQRSIPPNITRLTGITNEMVRHAPVFAEIAEGLSAFMQDSIFVAHNVNFDYGFIVQEFARLDVKFRLPKFCTCTGMRRYYPGHPSYSLGILCERYDIALAQHHRALCDAEAAAQLLNLINAKRMGSSVASDPNLLNNSF